MIKSVPKHHEILVSSVKD